MTIIRKLALGISAVVVKFASSGCKDWAEASLQEAALIQSDMSALRWAIGSTRVLLDRREALIGTLADAAPVARKFIDAKRNQTGTWWLMLLQTFTFLLRFFNAKNWVERVGCCVVVLTTLCLGIQYFFEQRRMDALLDNDIEDEVLFYKTELRRSLQSYPGLFMIFFLCVLLVGMFLSYDSEAHSAFFKIFIGVLAPLLTLLALHTRRLNQRRLEHLKILLPEQPQAHT